MSQIYSDENVRSEVQVSKKFSIFNTIRKFLLFFFALKKKFYEWLDKKESSIVVKKLMEDSCTYDEWKNFARELDKLHGKEDWKVLKETSLYDYKEVEKLIKILQKKREIKDIGGLVHYIKVNLMKNLYSTFNPALYQYANYGTKHLVEVFEDEMLKSLEFIANFNDKAFPLYRKMEFFSETRHSYGRTALLLSGGASLGMFHLGVIKTLYEANLLPKIVCGSSAGSIVAAMLCTETIDRIPFLFERDLSLGAIEFKAKNNSLLSQIYRYITSGVLLDVEVLIGVLREHLGDLTFQEAFDKTGWILNITVTGYQEHDNHRVLNYLTAPNVLIWSACSASSCVPGIFDPVELLCKNEYGHIVPYNSNKKKFIDGTMSADLPMQRISELFNVNIFIVSQTNPWVVPFLEQDDNKAFYNAEKKKLNLWKILKNLLFSEIKHRCQQVESLGILPLFITKWFNLITQDYRGHVTIFPVPKLTDYIKMFSNPSKEHIAYCIKHSSKRTFPSKILFLIL